MIDKKEVINGLEKCLNCECDECTKAGASHSPWDCTVFTAHVELALELLKEQEAEIERLKRPDCEHANHDGAGCLGYCGCEQDDEPIDACKQCEKYTGNICAEY